MFLRHEIEREEYWAMCGLDGKDGVGYDDILLYTLWNSQNLSVKCH